MDIYTNNCSQISGDIVRSKKRSFTDDNSEYGYSDDINNSQDIVENSVNNIMIDITQILSVYVLWKAKHHNKNAVFELSFKKNPYGGEYTVFAGLDDMLKIIKNFKFNNNYINYLKSVTNITNNLFFNWLLSLNTNNITIHALKEGTLCFPNIPIIRIEGSLAICQLLESTIINIINKSSLICTYASRLHNINGNNKTLCEYKTQSLMVSKYNYLGGYSSTTNVEAGIRFGIQVNLVMNRSYILSFKDYDYNELNSLEIDGKSFYQLVKQYQHILKFNNTNKSELAAFATYASYYPDDFVAHVDTYDTLKSGILNFIIVACVLHFFGKKAKGVHIGSGDLAYLSKEVRKMFIYMGSLNTYFDYFKDFKISVSNNIDENILIALNHQNHEINEFCIQDNNTYADLDFEYALVEIDSKPQMNNKISIPAKKNIHRLYYNNEPYVDILTLDTEIQPTIGKIIYCQDPFYSMKRVNIIPTKVESLLNLAYSNHEIKTDTVNLSDIRNYVIQQLSVMRSDHLRLTNPTPYKVSISEKLVDLMNQMRNKEISIGYLE